MIKRKNGLYEYRNSDILGTGSFATVFKCRNTQDGVFYALKVIDKDKMFSDPDMTEYLKQAMARELATQSFASKSGLPFFVNLYDNFEDEKFIYFVLELCDTTLLKYLQTIKIDEKKSLELILQVSIGLNFLHKNKITHRDIKPENILIKNDFLKIADFGFACDTDRMTTNLGTKPYMSPELFKGEIYSEKCDVWAVNTCLHKLLFGRFYFWDSNNRVMEKMIITKEFVLDPALKSNITPETANLLEKGYIKNMNNRPSMIEYMNHPAFNGLRPKYKIYVAEWQEKIQPAPPVINDNQANGRSLNLENFRVIDLFIKYRNNNLFYKNLAEFVIKNELNQIFALLLCRRFIQNLSQVILYYKNNTRPTVGPFAKYVDQQTWEQLMRSPIFKRVIYLYIENVKAITPLFSRIHSNILLFNKKNKISQSLEFDLNVNYSIPTTNYAKLLLKNLSSLKIDRKSSEEAEYCLQKIRLFEEIDPEKILS